MASTTFAQITHRFRNDDGSESAATWRQAQGDDDTWITNTKERIRFLIDETQSKSWTNVTFYLFYRRYTGGSWGSWTQITGSTPIQYATSSYFTDGADTLQRLTGGSGTFLTDNNGMDSNANINNSGGAGDQFEIEACLLIDPAQVVDGDLLEVRVYRATSELGGGYSDTPQITVSKPAIVSCTPGAISAAGRSATIFVPWEKTVTLETEDLSEFDSTYADGTLEASQDYTMIDNWCLKVEAYAAYTNRGRLTISSYLGTGIFRFRYYYRLDGATYGDGESSYCMDLAHSGGRLCDVGILKAGSNFTADPAYWSDLAGDLAWDMTNFSLYSTGLHWIEVEITRESYDGAFDGTMYIWQDSLDTPVAGKTGIDNFVAWSNLQYLTMGLSTPSSQPGISGYVYLDHLTVNNTGDEIGAASTGVTISCSVGAISASGQAASIVPGAVTISCPNPGAISASGQASTIVPVTDIPCTVGAISAAGQIASIIPGAVSIACTNGAIAIAGISAAIVPGAVSITCGVGAISAAGHSADVGSISIITCTVGALVAGGSSASILPGSVSVACSVGAIAIAGQGATITAVSSVSIACTVGAATIAGSSATILPGAVTVACAVGAVTLSGQAASIVAVTVIPCTVGAAAISGNSTSILPGAISISCSVASLSIAGQNTTILAGESVVTCAVGALTASGSSATILPGGVNVSCSAGAIAIAGFSLQIIPGAISVSCSVGSLAISGYTATVTPSAPDRVITCTAGALAIAGLATYPFAWGYMPPHCSVVLSDHAAGVISLHDQSVGVIEVGDQDAYTLTIGDS